MTDVSGRLALQQNFNGFSNEEKINMEALAPGIYFLEANEGTRIKVIKN